MRGMPWFMDITKEWILYRGNFLPPSSARPKAPPGRRLFNSNLLDFRPRRSPRAKRCGQPFTFKETFRLNLL